LSGNAALAGVWDHCSGPPTLIGNCWRSPPHGTLPPELDQRRRTADFWITIDMSGELPALTSVYCCGFLYRTASQFLFYDPPDGRCSYLSDDPFTFDWKSSSSALAQSRDDGATTTDLQFVLRQISSTVEIQEELMPALDQICRELGSDRSPPPSGRLRRRTAAIRERAESQPIPRRQASRFFIQIAHLLLLLWRIGCHLTLVFINSPLPLLVGGGRLKDRSAVLRQVDRRIVELTQWPEM
jgi:hypothetical protein